MPFSAVAVIAVAAFLVGIYFGGRLYKVFLLVKLEELADGVGAKSRKGDISRPSSYLQALTDVLNLLVDNKGKRK